MPAVTLMLELLCLPALRRASKDYRISFAIVSSIRGVLPDMMQVVATGTDAIYARELEPSTNDSGLKLTRCRREVSPQRGC
jgi:hypothetical protein